MTETRIQYRNVWSVGGVRTVGTPAESVQECLGRRAGLVSANGIEQRTISEWEPYTPPLTDEQESAQRAVMALVYYEKNMRNGSPCLQGIVAQLRRDFNLPQEER